MSDELAEVFENAADYMEANGWTQGAQVGGDGSVCVQGAIRFGNEWHHSREVNFGAWLLYHAAGGALSRVLGKDPLPPRGCTCPVCSNEVGWMFVTRWNDQQCRSQQEALDLLRKAAKVERTADE